MYDPTKAAAGEARLTVLRGILQDHIGDLGTALSRFEWARELYPIETTQVQIGDFDRLWPASQGLVKIAVCSGGSKDGQDFSAEPEFVGGRFSYVFRTAIYVYLHSEWPKVQDPSVQAERRELAREVISDWLRAVFNDQAKYGHVMIPLGTNEFNATPGQDFMSNCHARIGYKGFFFKGAGGGEGLYGINIEHVGRIM